MIRHEPKPHLRRIVRVTALLLVSGFLLGPEAFVRMAAPASANAPPAPESVKPYSRKPSKEALKWADKELQRMSLDEKISQLISVGINATFLNQDSEAFKALRHQVVDNHVGGADLLLKPADPDAALRGVRAAVKSGRLTEKRIEESARKVLAAKYDLGLVQQRITPLEEIDRAVAGKKALELADEIAERAITLLRDDAKLLSFPKLQTYVVAYGDMPSLQEATERAVLGQSDIGGRLPISLPGLYPRGTGIQLQARPQK